MSRKDLYHEVVKNALQKDGWTVTRDPLHVAYGKHNLYIDLGAEETISAEKNGQKIAVEIKSFVSRSAIYDLYIAVGQYNVYRDIMSITHMEQQLFLAVPNRVYLNLFDDELGKMVVERQKIMLLVFDPDEERIITWIR